MIGILGYISTALVLLGRIGFRTLYFSYLLLKRTGLWVLLIAMVVILPQLLGTYTYLRAHGVAWYFAIPSSFGVEMGGAMFTAWNNLNALAASGAEFSAIALTIGIATSITGILWYWYFWFKANKLFARTMSTVPILLLGAIVFSLMIVITMMVDMYVLPEQTLRVSGMTFFLEHPQAASEPLSALFSGAEYTPPNSTIVNQTTNETGVKSAEIIKLVT